MQPEPRRLQELLPEITYVALDGDPDVLIRGLTHDSRRVQPGWLFIAYEGVYQDVHRYIPDALNRGAAAVLVEMPIARLRDEYPGLAAGATIVEVLDSRLARGHLAAALYGHPSREMDVIGVTGTDGKTTTTTLTHAMLRAAGRRAGLVSTVAAQYGQQMVETGLHTTTPEPEDLQAFLATMHEEGVTVAVIEATSHGLHQHRLAAVAFDVAVLTNITHNEALEYHGTFEAYNEAKASLFHALLESPERAGVARTAVLNAADPSFERFRAIPVPRQVTYSLTGPADYGAEDIEHTPAGLQFTAVTPAGRLAVRSPLLGAYNVANILAAMAATSALGVGPDAWCSGVAAVEGIPGRMEVIDEGQPFLAIVDFAHTPNALMSALATAHELVGPAGRVIAVFGCAGMRDPGKRRAMGRLAGELADLTFVTAEDPRTEDLDVIIGGVEVGLRETGARKGTTFWRVPDRGEAILRACEVAGPADVVIVCGKGHEQSMCFGETEYPWDDRDALRAALRGRAYGDLPTREPGARS